MKTNNLVKESKKHKLKLIRGLSSAIVIFLIFLTLGAFVYSAVEKWDYLDSLYFTVITVTTVGYGDFFPQTPVGKIFTMFFSFFGIAMAFYFFSIIGKYVFRKAFEKKLKEHHEKLIEHIKSHVNKNSFPKKK